MSNNPYLARGGPPTTPAPSGSSASPAAGIGSTTGGLGSGTASSASGSSARYGTGPDGQGLQSLRLPPRRSSSYATVVPAATPFDQDSDPSNPDRSTGAAAADFFLSSKPSLPHSEATQGDRQLPEIPKEYQTPRHTELTPLRAHYLKRELVGGQLARELEALARPDALGIIGWPFDRASVPRTAQSARYEETTSMTTARAASKQVEDSESADLPFLRFFLHHFVMTFPFLSQVDTATFYSKKLQPFIQSFMARNISMNEEREAETGTQTKRHKLAGKAEKHLGLLISSAIKLADNGGREEVVRIVDVKEALAPAQQQQHQGGSVSPRAADSFQVNVIGIRTVVTKLRLGRRSKHEEFIIRTSRKDAPHVYVSRRYGDFVKLSEMLRSELPEFDIRAPPAKDRRGVEGHTGPISPVPNSAATQGSAASAASQDSDNTSLSDQQPTVMLARERNRLTLRAYLRILLNTPEIANSPTVQGFLLSNPTELSPAEEADAARREEMDRLREAETNKFRSEVENRVRDLEQHLRTFKNELVKRDGLSRVFATVRTTKDIKDLPTEYQKVFEWGRISLASTIYQLFLGSDNSSAMFAQFKRVHGIMPYFMMRQILKISNPVSMIRAGLDLFLARPFGSASLLQRMFSSGLETEVKELRDDMVKVQSKVQDDTLCERIKRFVRAPRELQTRFREEAKAEGKDTITVLMRSRELEPPLSPQSMQRVHRASIAFKDYQDWVSTLEDPDDDEGPDNDDAWLFEDLHVLLRMEMRLRDKEQMLELIFEGSTSELLKDIVTIFYEPLAKVYKAANISDSLYDLQMFINDLIKTVESAEVNVASANMDPQKTVTIFMDLVQRHEHAFYNFVHQVHSKGEDLFDGLMHWIELFLNFVRDGLNPEPVMLDFLLPHGGEERSLIMGEIDALIEYHRTLKIAHHERLRRRLVKGEISGAAAYTTGAGAVGSGAGPSDPNAFGASNPETDAAFVEGVLSKMNLSEVADDIDDINAEDDEDSDDEIDHRSDDFVDARSESPEAQAAPRGLPSSTPNSTITSPISKPPSNNPYASFMPASVAATQTTLVVNLPPGSSAGPPGGGMRSSGVKPPPSGSKGRRVKPTAILEPELTHIPKLVPIFTELLRPTLETSKRVQQLRQQQQQSKPSGAIKAAQTAIRGR